MKLSIRQKLLGAFGVDLLLMFLLGGFALVNMSLMGRTAEHVGRYTIPSIQNVGRIHDQVDRYRTLQLEFMVHTNAADKDRLERLMGRVEADVAELLGTQRRLIRRGGGEQIRSLPELEDALESFESLWKNYVEDNRQRFLPAVRRSNTGTVQPAWSRLHPMHQKLAASVERLARLDEEAARQAMGLVSRTHRGSRRFIIGDTVLSLIVSASVGLLLAATLAKRILHLSQATRKVAAGELEQHVADPGGDELAQLAGNFNDMVASLRHQRQALEQRNEALEASLEQQRLLTRDLVERTRAEAKASRARAEAEARDSAKSLFLATMSHELRTPLNAILGFVQVMRLEAERDGERRQLEDLGRIDAAGKHLLTVISNLLDFSKIEQGKMTLEIIEFRVDELAREVAGIVQPLADERGNRLALEISGELGPMRSDPGKLRQILFNLLSNAVKFTDGGDVRFGVAATGDGFRFEIEDTGIGIESEHLDIIFEPFRQAESSTTRRFGGTGLGLVVSRQLAELLGGDISVTSRPGRGSTFMVELPAVLPAVLAADRGRACISRRASTEEHSTSDFRS